MDIIEVLESEKISYYTSGQHINRASRVSSALTNVRNNEDSILLPYTESPETTICRVLTIPASSDLLALVLGKLGELTDPEYYDTFNDADTYRVTQDMQAALSRLSNADYGGCMMQAGDIIYTGSPTRSGLWLPCNGQTVEIADYPALYTAIGDNFGPDTASTFVLPDLRGRVPLGVGSGPGLTNRVIGDAIGQERVTLSEGEMPSHTHDNIPHSHAEAGTAPTLITIGAGAPAAAAVGVPGITATSGITILSAGAGSSHDNMPPALALYAYIFYGSNGI